MDVFCEACKRIFASARIILSGNSEEDGGPFKSFGHWQSSAASSSCQLCVMLSRMYNDHRNRHENSEDLSFKLHSRLLHSRSNNNSIELSLWGLKRRIVQSVFFRVEGEIDASSQTVNNNIKPWSRDTIKLIRGWLKCCQQTHHCTSHRFQTRRLPLRLLDLDPTGLYGGSNLYEDDLDQFRLETNPNVHLRQGSMLPLDTEYLTLSHRWDESPALILSEKTIHELSSAVSLPLLNDPSTQTFQDAIKLGRAVGFRYLWIDALCIKQDDPEEKKEEIGRMSQIYTNATANISATGSRKAADGLFLDCSWTSAKYGFGTPGHPGSYQVLEAFVETWSNDVWSNCVDKGALNLRGWVFQERLLAPRVIHFSRAGVFWECFNLAAVPRSQKGVEWVEVKTAWGHEKAGISINAVLPHLPQTGINLGDFKIWAEVVERYSRLELTFFEDRLTALSSLAGHIARKRRVEFSAYHFGHWRDELLMTLAWHVNSIEQTPQPREYSLIPFATYVAPSWSWGSVHGGVTFLRVGYEGVCDVKVLADIVNTAAGDSFVSVPDGIIRLHCFLCPTSWDSEKRTLVYQPRDVGDKATGIIKNRFKNVPDSVQVYWDSKFFSASSEDSSGFKGAQPDINSHADPSVWIQLAKPERVYVGESLYLVPLYQARWPLEYSEYQQTQTITGLILHRSGYGRGQYIRVGIFKWYKRYGMVSFHDSQESQESQEFQHTLFGSLPIERDDYLEPPDDRRFLIDMV